MERARETGSEIAVGFFFLLIHHPDGCDNQGLARPKKRGAWDPSVSSYMGGTGPDSWAISAFPGGSKEQSRATEGETGSQIWNASFLKGLLTLPSHNTVPWALLTLLHLWI